MRALVICLLFILFWGQPQSQAPDIVERARRRLVPAFPALSESAEPTVARLSHVASTALGCRLISGLPLATPVDVYRLEFPTAADAFALHITADGALAQPCDERFPNLGAGVIPVSRAGLDSDGDGTADSADACPQIAGLPAMARRGCPQPSSGDRDGDGTADGRDHCPSQAGAAGTHGCALMRDEDGDGIPDQVDICQSNFGLSRPDFALGCPADGSGASSRRRGAGDICRADGDTPIYAERADEATITGALNDAPDRSIIGRTAENDWLQLNGGWVKREGLQLTGACYNIPLVNPVPGGATGCYMRPLGGFANVRQAPAGAQVARISGESSFAALGQDISADWLFYRGGWVNRAVLALSGNCAKLPILDPATAATGTIHFCPPDYPGLLPPRIGIGPATARIASDTIANRLRAKPDINAEQVGELPPRMMLDAVLDGPACKAPHIWWQVKAGERIGWTVESDVNFNFYYLEPVENSIQAGRSDRAPSAQERSGSNLIIHSANAPRLDTIKLLAAQSPRVIAWSPRGSELVLIAANGAVERYSYPSFARLPLGAQSRRATAVAYQPAGNALAIGTESGSVILADLNGEQSIADAISVEPHSAPIGGLAWSSAGDQLAVISGDESLKLARRAGTLALWALEPTSQPMPQRLLHYRFPYPLTAVAFSADSRLLAVTGESTSDKRAALWVYRAADGALLFSKALQPAGGGAWLVASADRALGDFVYSSGDSLYQIHLETGEDWRIYHQAGLMLPRFAFRRQVLPAAEALFATTTVAQNGAVRLRIANALNVYSPTVSLNIAAADFAFSPDGRALAIAEPGKDRALILGVMQE